MDRKIRLISTDFDGTLVAHDSDPVLDPGCIELIGQLQRDDALWTINTGRSVELLESGLLDFEFPIRPDFILTSERDVFRPSHNGGKWACRNPGPPILKDLRAVWLSIFNS